MTPSDSTGRHPMKSFSPPARDALGVRAVLLAFTLAVAVLIHHQIAGGAGHGMTAPAAMAVGNARTQLAQPTMDMQAAPSGSQAASVSAGGHSGCTGGQMCAAAGVAKTPTLAPILLAAAADGGSSRAAVPFRCDAALAPPPGALAVLRI